MDLFLVPELSKTEVTCIPQMEDMIVFYIKAPKLKSHVFKTASILVSS